jgi:hypothetical protein
VYPAQKRVFLFLLDIVLPKNVVVEYIGWQNRYRLPLPRLCFAKNVDWGAGHTPMRGLLGSSRGSLRPRTKQQRRRAGLLLFVTQKVSPRPRNADDRVERPFRKSFCDKDLFLSRGDWRSFEPLLASYVEAVLSPSPELLVATRVVRLSA